MIVLLLPYIYIYIEDSKKVDEKQNIGGAYSQYRVVGY